MVQGTQLITGNSWDFAGSGNWYTRIPNIAVILAHLRFRLRGRDGHDPARRLRARTVIRDSHERLEVRVACDNERATRIEHNIIGRKRRRHARAERERLRGGVPRVKLDLAERRGGDRYLCAVWRDRDAVREGDVRCDDDGRGAV